MLSIIYLSMCTCAHCIVQDFFTSLFVNKLAIGHIMYVYHILKDTGKKQFNFKKCLAIINQVKEKLLQS